jgi:hypothetical protein
MGNINTTSEIAKEAIEANKRISLQQKAQQQVQEKQYNKWLNDNFQQVLNQVQGAIDEKIQDAIQAGRRSCFIETIDIVNHMYNVSMMKKIESSKLLNIPPGAKIYFVEHYNEADEDCLECCCCCACVSPDKIFLRVHW